VAHAPGELDDVLLELHPRPASISETAPAEIMRYIARGDGDVCGQAIEHGDEGGPVRLACGDPAQHAAILAESWREAR
jgi:hypothetical protein